MPVEEKGETDVIISKELIARERKKLEELKGISAEKKKIVAEGKTTPAQKLESREAAKRTKIQQKKVKDLEKKLKEQEKKQRETDDKIKNFFAKAGSFGSNPQEFVTERVFDILRGSRIIPILGTAVGFAIGVFKLLEKEFGDGGIFDLRVRVHDIVRAIVGLKQLIDIDAGEIFMSPDTRLNTFPPETSNTESLRDGHVRYNQLTLGY